MKGFYNISFLYFYIKSGIEELGVQVLTCEVRFVEYGRESLFKE